jgi:hypothetical protein
MKEDIFVDEKLQGFNGDEDDPCNALIFVKK